MPSQWGKSSSKDVKKKKKNNLFDILHRFINPTEQKGNVRSGGSQRCTGGTTSGKGSQSQTVSRSTSPSSHVSRCQSFADRPRAQPLPLPRTHSDLTHKPLGIGMPKSLLEKRGKSQLFLPLPTANHLLRRLNATDVDGDLATALVSSNCSINSNDPADSQLQSPVGNDFENGCRGTPSSMEHKHHSILNVHKNTREGAKSSKPLFNSHISSSSKVRSSGICQSNMRNAHHGAEGSAPDSSLSSPSRSPNRTVRAEQILTSAFWSTKPYQDVNFLGSTQCSSPGSGQTSGHNSVGGDMLGQLFWQHSRGSPECSPIPSPRLTSAGPSSRINSGAVSPLHPRVGGTAPESPTTQANEGRKQCHRLPLPPIDISSNSPFSPLKSTSNPLSSTPRTLGRADTPTSSGSCWKKGKLIGRGTFGHVYVGFNSETGEICAMKEVTLFSDDAKSKESAKQLGQEIALLSRLRHPNIVQYYGSETVDDKLYIYLEYVSGGSIHKLLREFGQFGEVAIRNYTQQILSGLAYLHAKNTVHRDIKGANILVDQHGRVIKLADFGMAKHITGQSCPLSFKGSPYWMAPEVIKNSNGCNLAVDIWSLGCTVLEMATSKPPWSQYEGIAAMFKIGNSKELPGIPDHLSADGKDFVKRCLQREPSNRPTAAELLLHPFVKNAAPLEKSFSGFEPLELSTCVPCGASFKGGGHASNLSCLDMEGLAIHQLQAAKPISMTRHLSCPVSPIGSPLLNSRTPQHINGWMSPSPISSPRTNSGTSTPLTGSNGAIPFSQLKNLAYHEGFASVPRSPKNHYASMSMYHDAKLEFFQGGQRGSPVIQQVMTSETEILRHQLGRTLHGDFRELYNGHFDLTNQVSHQHARDQVKPNS